MLSKCWEEVDDGDREKREAAAALNRSPRLQRAVTWAPLCHGSSAPTGRGSQPWMLVPRRPWPSSFPEEGQSRAGSRSPHILLTPTISVLLVLGHGGPGTGGSEALSPRSLSSWAPGCWQWEALCPRWAQYAQALDVAVALVGRRREEKTDEPSSASQARIHTNISVTPSLPLPTPRA